MPAVPLKSEAMPAEGTLAAVPQKDVDAADSGASVVESTTTTFSSARRGREHADTGHKDDYLRQLAKELQREPPAW